MAIDPKTDETFRDLVDHALHNRVEDVAATIAEAGEKGWERVSSLVIQASAYVAIDASQRWPNDADLKETARIASESRASLPVTADEIHAYLSQVVFGTDRVDGIFKDPEKAALVPLCSLANLLISFVPPAATDQWGYLDVIESAIEAADQARTTDLPAMVFRFGRK